MYLKKSEKEEQIKPKSSKRKNKDQGRNQGNIKQKQNREN